MDFAALMSKEISKARKASPAKDDELPKKYQKRADIEAERRAAYQAEQDRLRAEKEAKAAAKRKREEDEAEAAREREEKRRRLAEESRRRREEQEAAEERARRKRLGLPEVPHEKEADGEATPDEDDIPEEELMERLREMGEPAKLFGETHKGRLRRYKKASTVLSAGPIPTTLQLVEEKDMKVPETVPTDPEGKKYLFRQLASYFSMVLSAWQAALDKEEPRDTFASKTAYNAMVQSRINMVPLFRKFENGDLEDSILTPIVEIVRAAQERRYVDANDGYLRLSIGKAAWPIGVTMVGIHERSAREKLHESDKQGHVMGDEITRKFLQSIKRCLSFAQVRWPPEDMRQLMG